MCKLDLFLKKIKIKIKIKIKAKPTFQINVFGIALKLLTTQKDILNTAGSLLHLSPVMTLSEEESSGNVLLGKSETI